MRADIKEGWASLFTLRLLFIIGLLFIFIFAFFVVPFSEAERGVTVLETALLPLGLLVLE